MWNLEHKGISWVVGDPVVNGDRATVTLAYSMDLAKDPSDHTELYPVEQLDALVLATTLDRRFAYKEATGELDKVARTVTETWHYERAH